MRPILLATALLLAGCAAPAAVDPAGTPDAPATAPPRTETMTGTLAASAEAPQGGGFLLPSQSALQVPVDADGSTLLLEMRWDRPQVELGLSHYLPDGGFERRYDASAGDGALRIVVEDVETGDHVFRVGAKAGGATSYDLRVTVFEGVVPDAWSAFG